MEDICDVINRKIWTAEELLSQAREIKEKSKSLSPNKRKDISITISDWSEDGVKKHIEAVREAVISPIRHENKEKLKKIGIKIQKIPQEKIFDNSELIDKISNLFKDIKNISNQLTDILTSEDLIERWLKESINYEVQQRLQNVVNNKSSFKEILEKEIDRSFKFELLKRSLEDVSFLEKADEIISKIEYLNSFGVLLDYDVEFEKYCERVDVLSSKIKNIKGNFGISEDVIKQKIEGEALSKGCEIIKKLEEKCNEEKRKLLNEWKMYASTLKSFGDEIPEEPQNTLPKLKEVVSSMKEIYLKHLGESSFRLLKFLRGEGGFPDDIKMEEIKKTLEVLRPIFLKSLKEED